MELADKDYQEACRELGEVLSLKATSMAREKGWSTPIAINALIAATCAVAWTHRPDGLTAQDIGSVINDHVTAYLTQMEKLDGIVGGDLREVIEAAEKGPMN